MGRRQEREKHDVTLAYLMALVKRYNDRGEEVVITRDEISAVWDLKFEYRVEGEQGQERMRLYLS